MVELLTAGRVGQHTAGVELEALLVSLDGDRHGADVHCGKQIRLRALSDVDEFGQGGSDGLSLLAGSISGGVRVSGLRRDSLVRDDVLEAGNEKKHKRKSEQKAMDMSARWNGWPNWPLFADVGKRKNRRQSSRTQAKRCSARQCSAKLTPDP